jgi:hypothetical protein
MGSRVRLQFAVEGALGLASALTNLASCDRRIDVTDEALTRANLAQIFAGIAATGDSKQAPALNLCLILSGHGDEANGRPWFCTYQARPGAVDLTGADIAGLIRLTGARRVTAILDFCHAGGVAADLHRALATDLDADAVLVLAGAAAAELAYEHPALGRGLFTIALHEAATERGFYTLAAAPGSEGALRTEFASLFVFARERTEQLAYLYASGKRQTPEIYGAGRVALTWTADALAPPHAPEPRRMFASRLRRIVGWSAILALLTGGLLFLLQYHLTVGPEGWVEVRAGPPWMASLVPQGIKVGVQFPLAVTDLATPSPRWDERRIAQRAELFAGQISGLATHTIDGRENWEFKLWPELSRAAQRRVNFALGRDDPSSVCAANEPRRDRARDYQFAVEAALIDRKRACAPAFFLEQGPEVEALYAVTNPATHLDYGLSDLSDQAIRMYLAGLALAYRELRDADLRRRALEAAILLVSIRVGKGAVRTADWLAYMRFLEDVAKGPRLEVAAGTATFPRLSVCARSWCELAEKLAAFFAAGADAASVGNGAGMLTWLIARVTDRQATEGDGAHSWALPPLLLLARHGDLGETEFDWIIRFFRFIVPGEQILIDPIWLPRFARVLKFRSSWKGGLGRCAFQIAGSRVACSDLDADIAANILSAQGRFLEPSEQSMLLKRLDGRMQQDRIALYGSQIRDVGCWSKLPDHWLEALERSLDYQLRITPVRTTDPLTGVSVIEVTDLAAAHALAASILGGADHTATAVAVLARYAANHWSYEGLQPLFRALAAALAAQDVSAVDRLLASHRGDAMGRSAVLEALTLRTGDGLLHDPVFSRVPSYLRLDAVLVAKHLIAQYTFELDTLCEGPAR